MNENPCRYCVPPKRTATCHCDCPDWLDYKSDLNAKKEAVHKAKMKEVYIREKNQKKAIYTAKFKTNMKRSKRK